ncbi:LacI family transcriptional regulator [Cryobacterium sp. LW097]|uniref:LacI family DNA-binding transcriptional regulator n=1 Tax=unclassified Cryobacterium TaxID=2649013 RepID=UPI000B4C6E43|nr:MULTISPECIES: LacI family DNA-binding transcriptional regulator [unclassified Cryobacterium]ASD21012.1 LacI family transcriptional regulator [Cryobacterium sp. LW097]TFC58660.1 LacI family transcriptional regulator [Cryobacterium sp. TMB3-1-2]TFC61724.1 LacI family transcriptional regulator [Cryobacterium sp. TMB1-7]TFC67081.1 LacI family transcriptional regulator [Cryobacterium sp. TMB3-15]TFC73406.1 LacI family transcriptional regulator [Cryobacterium sp. TMB3-10]
MAATLRDVAALAGVSIKTVSNVVHDFQHIRPATRERVRAAIDELGYKPNISARSLRSGRTGVIGLALPELSLSYFAELADAIIQAAERRHLVVLLEQTGGGDRGREIAMLSSPRLQLTDGLIFSPLGLSTDDAAMLNVGYPMVLLGERVFGGPVDHVTMHNVEASKAATLHLISRGRRRIAIIGAHEGEVVGSAVLRVQGYREALAEAGIPFDPALICNVGRWHRADGAEAMRALIDTGVSFDAVFGLNDTLALGAMRVAQVAGLRVPEDVMFIGFDALDETKYSLPTLSTIDPGRDEIADTAVRLLVQRIEEGVTPRVPEVYLADYTVIDRESTAG